MQPILAVTVPFFALVLGGWLATRRGVLPESAIPGLNGYVLYFALPCALFRWGAGVPVLQLFDPVVVAVYAACSLAMVGVGLAAVWRPSRGVGLRDSAFAALVAAFPNSGFMGVPMLVALIGPASAGPMVCTLLVDLFLTSSLCIALSQAQGAAEHGARTALLRSLKGAISNPLPWAIAAGAAASATGWRLPGPVDVGVKMLADSASPVALFTIGGVLWRAGRNAHAQPAPWGVAMPVAGLKLLLHPLLVGGACWAAQRLGARLDTLQVHVLVLCAALPSASSVTLLTERFGANTGLIARIVLASTVIAFVSFSALAWWLGVRPA